MATPTTPTLAQQADLSLKELTDLYRIDEQLIRAGGGKGAIARQHEKGRLTARERVELLVDGAEQSDPTKLSGVLPAGGSPRFLELGMWSAWGMYGDQGGAPSAGVITGVGRVSGTNCMIIANDATVKAGAFFPMTCKKIIRAQTIAMAARLPLIYLVDSAGVFLPMQEDVFPDTDDFGRIFRNNAVISAEGIPQIAAIMGFCVAGGGYLPVLCDTLLMTEGSGLYLAGPALVKAAIGQSVTDEDLGGAKMHAAISGTIDFREKDDVACIERLRSLMGKYAPNQGHEVLGEIDGMMRFMSSHAFSEIGDAYKAKDQEGVDRHFKERYGELASVEAVHRRYEAIDALLKTGQRLVTPPARGPADVYSIFSDKQGAQYDVRDLIACFVDAKADNPKAPDFDEYKAEYGQTIICGYARIGGRACGICANQKKVSKSGHGQVQMGGVIYEDSAEKAARFIMDCNQRKIPIVFIHDTSGFMVGKESEQGGIIRAGAKMVNAMSNCIVPKVVLITGSSYGAGNYAMCGRAFDQFISLAWPNARCAVMGANQATGVLAMIEEKSRERKGEVIDPETHKQILAAVHAGYTAQADVRHGAARGWVDRLIEPGNTRAELIAALAAADNWDYSRTFRTGVLQT